MIFIPVISVLLLLAFLSFLVSKRKRANQQFSAFPSIFAKQQKSSTHRHSTVDTYTPRKPTDSEGNRKKRVFQETRLNQWSTYADETPIDYSFATPPDELRWHTINHQRYEMVYVYDHGTKAKKKNAEKAAGTQHYRLFHGTSLDGLKGIFSKGFRQGRRTRFGYGIYFALDVSTTSNPTASQAFKVAKTYANAGPIIEYALKTTKDIDAIKPNTALHGSIGRVDNSNAYVFNADFLRVAPTVTAGAKLQARAIYFPYAVRHQQPLQEVFQPCLSS
jgi:hypothetical protein